MYSNACISIIYVKVRRGAKQKNQAPSTIDDGIHTDVKDDRELSSNLPKNIMSINTESLRPLGAAATTAYAAVPIIPKNIIYGLK